jgi:hypothetical protein
MASSYFRALFLISEYNQDSRYIEQQYMIKIENKDSKNLRYINIAIYATNSNSTIF